MSAWRWFRISSWVLRVFQLSKTRFMSVLGYEKMKLTDDIEVVCEYRSVFKR